MGWRTQYGSGRRARDGVAKVFWFFSSETNVFPTYDFNVAYNECCRVGINLRSIGRRYSYCRDVDGKPTSLCAGNSCRIGDNRAVWHPYARRILYSYSRSGTDGNAFGNYCGGAARRQIYTRNDSNYGGHIAFWGRRFCSVNTQLIGTGILGGTNIVAPVGSSTTTYTVAVNQPAITSPVALNFQNPLQWAATSSSTPNPFFIGFGASTSRPGPEGHVVVCELIYLDSEGMQGILITAERNCYHGSLFINHKAILSGIFLRCTRSGGVAQRFISVKLEGRELQMYSAISMKVGNKTSRPVVSECLIVKVPVGANGELFNEMRRIAAEQWTGQEERS